MDAIYYSLHDLIEVIVDTRIRDTIIKAIDFQIGYFKTTKDHLRAPSQIIIRPYSDFLLEPTRTFHSFHVSRGITGQCLDDPNRRLAFEKGKSSYTIYVSRSYIAINLVIQLLLIEHGISLISAAAATDVNGRVTLLPGAGGAGKSVLSVEMVKYHGYRLLGDDTVCLSERGDCLSFPRAFTLKEYHQSTYAEIFQRLKVEAQKKTDSSARATAVKVLNFGRENAPFLGLLNGILYRLNRPDLQAKFIPSFSVLQKPPRLATVPIEKIVGLSTIADRGSLERIVYLERYAGPKFRLESISVDSLCRRVIATIHNEWALNMRPFFTMGALEIVDLPDYFNRVATIIRSGISKKKCDLLLIPDNASPSELSDYFFHCFD